MKNNKYDKSLKNLLKSSHKDALTHIRDLRDAESATQEKVLEQKLMSFRLAIKIGNGTFLDENELRVESVHSKFLQAEAYFVKALILTHKEKLRGASDSFLQASELYLVEGMNEKSLLSRFNSLIAIANAGTISHQEELNLCSEILQSARDEDTVKIQALCLRQKSYCYFASERFLAALEEVKEVIKLFEMHGPVSDYHLALIHAADCCLEAGDEEQAKLYLDYLPAQVDTRVEFPRAYVMAKLKQEILDESHFGDINSHWRARHKKHLAKQSVQSGKALRKAYWDMKTHRIIGEDRKLLGKIKPNSLEGSLLKILMKGPHSKELLCEVLWPDFSQSHNLDDRFFRLKSRLQQKLGNILIFDGQNYLLSVNIQWLGSAATE